MRVKTFCSMALDTLHFLRDRCHIDYRGTKNRLNGRCWLKRNFKSSMTRDVPRRRTFCEWIHDPSAGRLYIRPSLSAAFGRARQARLTDATRRLCAGMRAGDLSVVASVSVRALECMYEKMVHVLTRLHHWCFMAKKKKWLEQINPLLEGSPEFGISLEQGQCISTKIRRKLQ